MKYGFVKTAAATPKIRVADCDYNANQIIACVKEAYQNGASLLVFPELCVTGYTCSDLFLQSTLLKAAEKAVLKIKNETKDLDIVFVVGVPIAVKQSLYNCGVVICKGEILGAVPKVNIPNYSEFYEVRHFTSGKNTVESVSYAGEDDVLISSKQIFRCLGMDDFTIGVEICEDLWVAESPSIRLAQSGAAIICNLSCSDDLIGKAQYRRDLVKMQSAKLCCGYVYCDAGFGESTTDMVFSAQNIIAENGTIVSESCRFNNGITYADIDVERLMSERRRTNTYIDYIPDSNSRYYSEKDFEIKKRDTKLSRTFPCTPFVPSDKSDLENRCEEILTIQATGLATRLAHTGIQNVVLGLSGGLDSTLALIVCVHAFDMLSLDRKNIHTVTMPCFGTTKRTKSNAEKLAEAYGVSFEEINITLAVRQHFSDIGHDESVTNITYENSQARERTQILMDLSNKYNGLVIGTGDLSELALGWATYNGDHMSMYAVNASIPKTLVRYLTAYEAQKSDGTLKNVLLDVLDTPVSPELLPPDKNGEIAQKTEDVVGPYELHDFFLYYLVRFGYAPSKIYYMAKLSFKDKYSEETIKKWLTVFIKRFFSQQFKRSCLPDGPKVGSVTLSPRSDWRMPSDASVKAWLDELENA
ncbi:NAD(+) synthase [Ruminococcus sp.]|uniref:NAD(+) synthase n=1 Tax=Ruminococcus sp. TaxID=41978 RepID=UPI002613F70B|nr:NAD(+) synthase [Ruminococcus sp.]MDD6990054.1 NAD(+) synthase [Ruminococcus sp.]MDY6202010.1 NAD(+) synthase [Ruminococcus sp.]